LNALVRYLYVKHSSDVRYWNRSHFRFNEAFPAVTASRVRLNILSSTAEAEIREFQLFSIRLWPMALPAARGFHF
jgi:hypothetical protein